MNSNYFNVLVFWSVIRHAISEVFLMIPFGHTNYVSLLTNSYNHHTKSWDNKTQHLKKGEGAYTLVYYVSK